MIDYVHFRFILYIIMKYIIHSPILFIIIYLLSSKTSTWARLEAKEASYPVKSLESLIGVCQRFPTFSPSQALASTCYNAVDYLFYIPSGSSLSSLEASVRMMLSKPGLSLLPNTCQLAIKKLLCANTYLRCPPNISLANISTYNYDIYSDLNLSYARPFQRPCASLCQTIESSCLGLGKLFGMTWDCNARYDYSSGVVTELPYRYDHINDAAICNAMTSKVFAIGSNAENYIAGTSGTCYGIVDQIYIPSSSQLAPLQPPYAIQSLIDSSLQLQVDALPKFMSSACNFALKKLLCRSSMPSPETISVYDAILASGSTQYIHIFASIGIGDRILRNWNITIPAYPAYSECINYQTTCASFLKFIPSLGSLINCNSTITTPQSRVIQRFPSTRQTILLLDLPLSTSTIVHIPFQSSPDMLTTAMSTFQTSCPDGFVIPDVPEDKDIRWIDGTGCAVPCRIPVYLDWEYQKINTAYFLVICLSMPFVIVIAVVWLTDPNYKKQLLTTTMMAFIVLQYLADCLVTFTPQVNLCRNNAVPINSDDGVNTCSVSGLLLLFCGFGIVTTMLMQSIDLFLMIIFGMKTEGYQAWYLGIIFSSAASIMTAIVVLRVYG
jgi:hypothetical protein